MNWKEQLGLELSAIVGGLVGGVISLTYEEKLSFFRAVFLIFSGGMIAGYGFNAVHMYWHLPVTWGGVVGFSLGLTGMRLLDILINLLGHVKKDPTIIFSVTKLLITLRNGRNIDTPGGDNSGDSSSVHPPRKGNKNNKD